MTTISLNKTKNKTVISYEEAYAWAQENNDWEKIKHKAQMSVAKAVSIGKLPSPITLTCVNCEKNEANVYHHESYKPEHWLKVIPLCHSCHRSVHEAKKREESTQWLDDMLKGKISGKKKEKSNPNFKRIQFKEGGIMPLKPTPKKQNPTTTIGVSIPVRDELKAYAKEYNVRLQELTDFLLEASIRLNLFETYEQIQQAAIEKEGLNVANGAPIDSFLARIVESYNRGK
jgi:hypothetical protein